MDGGKAICLTVKSGMDLWAFEYERPVPDVAPEFPALITIPTTAGTGAETESTAMVTHVGKGMKFCIWHPKCKPALALLDPNLTLGLPPDLTAWTGADAMTHAIEAYLVPGFHPLCDGAALEGLSLVAKSLPVSVREPNNLEARSGMLAGSCLAGISFLKGLGLVHAISAYGRCRIRHPTRPDQCDHLAGGVAVQPAGPGRQGDPNGRGDGH